MKPELPTKPGHYYWRVKDGDEWRRKAKMVDEGQEAWAVFDHWGNVKTSAPTEAKAMHYWLNMTDTRRFSDRDVENVFTIEEENGYTCEPVTIIRKEKE